MPLTSHFSLPSDCAISRSFYFAVFSLFNYFLRDLLYIALLRFRFGFSPSARKSESAQLWDKHNMTLKRIVKINQIKRWKVYAVIPAILLYTISSPKMHLSTYFGYSLVIRNSSLFGNVHVKKCYVFYPKHYKNTFFSLMILVTRFNQGLRLNTICKKSIVWARKYKCLCFSHYVHFPFASLQFTLSKIFPKPKVRCVSAFPGIFSEKSVLWLAFLTANCWMPRIFLAQCAPACTLCQLNV